MSDPVTTMIHAAVIQLRAEASVVGVGFDGRVAFASRGHLLGNRVDPDTVFYAASITKQMVAVLLAQAAVNQTIDVDDRIVHRLPELPAWMTDVCLHHLIHHTSDLPDVSDPTLGVPTSNRVVISRFQHVRPAQAPRPGAHYAYNNAGYVLLAEALSRTFGKSVSEMAYTQLFTPLGLLHTRLGGEAVSLTTVLDPPGTVGDGGLWTSATDLTAWLLACNHRALGDQVHCLCETTGSLSDGSELGYAWGTRITPTTYGPLITHGGSWDQWLAKTVRFPHRRVVVAILSLGSEEQIVSETGIRLATTLASQQASA